MEQRRNLVARGPCLMLLPATPAALLLPSLARARSDAAPPLDVPYVPTPLPVVDAMLELGRVGKDGVLYDLGSGDGRIVVRSATRCGCTGVGVDLDPERVQEARANAQQRRVTHLTRFEVGDVFEFDFSSGTVVTMYLLPSVNLKLRPRLLKELRPGTRIVSHDFDMGDWAAEATKDAGCSRLFLWTVPARS